MDSKKSGGNTDAGRRFSVVATDVVACTVKNESLYVRLIRVERPPHFPNNPGLPGGLVLPEETAEESAARHIEVKAGLLRGKYLEQLYTFSSLDRDPRDRVVSIAYLLLAPWESLTEEERADSNDAWWEPISKAKKLAYDHNEILTVALRRLRSRATYTTVISKLMPKEFTLSELEKTYACVLGTKLDKRNFRKKILKLKILKSLHKKRSAGRARPAELYTFISSRVEEIEVI